MKYLLLLVFISCGVAQQNKQDIEQPKPEKEITGLYQFVKEFELDASNYGVNLENPNPKFFISPDTEHVGCYNNDIVFSSSLWGRIAAFLNTQTSTNQYIKAMVYKGMALCVLKQEARTGFNKYDNIVPVPSSLTYKSGVAATWLEDYCYNASGFGIYVSRNGCDEGNYYQESLWEGYLDELFTQDTTKLFKLVEEFRTRV